MHDTPDSDVACALPCSNAQQQQRNVRVMSRWLPGQQRQCRPRMPADSQQTAQGWTPAAATVQVRTVWHHGSLSAACRNVTKCHDSSIAWNFDIISAWHECGRYSPCAAGLQDCRFAAVEVVATSYIDRNGRATRRARVNLHVPTGILYMRACPTAAALWCGSNNTW